MSPAKNAIPWVELAGVAEEARAHAYAPYSKYSVGTALLARVPGEKTTRVFAAANLENASFGLTVCAERNAVGAALFAGAREFIAVVVATPGPEAGAPCGMCRQVLAEFALDLPIALVVAGKIVHNVSLAKLLPHAFGAAHVRTKRLR